MLLANKTILIISPQSWGSMFLSKHHYAVELASAGNKVYFLNPPDVRRKDGKKFIVEPSGVGNLWLIHHRISFPYNLKFRLINVFHAFMKPHVRRMLETIGVSIDVVWSFDLGWLYPFSFFPGNAIKIFHPVDEPITRAAIGAAAGSDIIFSVTKEILEKYKSFQVRRHLINHGLAAAFCTAAPVQLLRRDDIIRVGFSGNLLRPDIDRGVLLQIISEHPGVKFECFGSYKASHSNIGGESDNSTSAFVARLQEFPNVRLHGVLDQRQLAESYQQVDAWLICYDIQKDQSKGTNYHKIMEYLSTGKVIVSNNVTAYTKMPELVTMSSSRIDNSELPEIFSRVVSNLDQYNHERFQEQRREYAFANTYRRQIERISGCLEGKFESKAVKIQ